MPKAIDTLSTLTVCLALTGALATTALRQTEADRSSLDQAYAQAMAQFRAHQYAAAYGRLMKLADAGHAPSAEAALLMLRNGKALFGTEWSATAAQQQHWFIVAFKGAPVLRDVLDNESGE